jgi:hypothetical protein
MRHFKRKGEEVRSLYFTAGGVPIGSHIRAFARQARMSSIIRFFRYRAKQCRGGEACEEFAGPRCRLALKTVSIFEPTDRDVLPEWEIEKFWEVDNNAATYKP